MNIVVQLTQRLGEQLQFLIELVEALRILQALVAMALKALDGEQYFFQINRFLMVVGNAGAHGCDHVAALTLAGENDRLENTFASAQALQLLNQLQAVEPGHVQVAKDNTDGRVLLKQLDGVLCRVTDLTRITASTEVLAKFVNDNWVIVDDEKFCRPVMQSHVVHSCFYCDYLVYTRIIAAYSKQFSVHSYTSFLCPVTALGIAYFVEASHFSQKNSRQESGENEWRKRVGLNLRGRHVTEMVLRGFTEQWPDWLGSQHPARVSEPCACDTKQQKLAAAGQTDEQQQFDICTAKLAEGISGKAEQQCECGCQRCVKRRRAEPGSLKYQQIRQRGNNCTQRQPVADAFVFDVLQRTNAEKNSNNEAAHCSGLMISSWYDRTFRLVSMQHLLPRVTPAFNKDMNMSRIASKGFAGDQRGAAAIEFAIVFVVFFAIFYGTVSYSLPLLMMQSFNNAAAEVARQAVALVPEEVSPEDYQALADSVASEQLAWLPATVSSALVVEATAPGSDGVFNVRIAYPYKLKPLVPALILPGVGAIPQLPDELVASSSIKLHN